MTLSPLFERLTSALQCLPGIGPRTAQRLGLHCLERDRDGALRVAEALSAALQRVGRCERCCMLSEDSPCALCQDPRRQRESLCVVETLSDLLAIEQAGGFRGLYFVLCGRLSPVDGVGPKDIGIDRLLERVRGDDALREVVLATNRTVSGEVTAQYIADSLRPFPVQLTRIAYGVPLGGELEYLDNGTLSHAFASRQRLAD